MPLTIFVNKKTGEPLRDSAVHARIVDAIKAEGADCWFASESSRLGLIIIQMILKKSLIFDVWFDSGSTHAFVLEDRADLSSPADLYLEGRTSIVGGSILHCCNLVQHVTAPPTKRS